MRQSRQSTAQTARGPQRGLASGCRGATLAGAQRGVGGTAGRTVAWRVAKGRSAGKIMGMVNSGLIVV